MKGLVVLLVIVLVSSLSFVVASIYNNNNNSYNKNNNQNFEIEEPKVLEFSTFTSAVCESKENYVYCKDEFFVKCNGEVSKAVDVAECNGIKIDTPKTLGFAVFEKDWSDPRN